MMFRVLISLIFVLFLTGFSTSNINLKFGNPSGASQNDLNNYLIEKPQYVLSYNCQIGTANWVSWEVDPSWYCCYLNPSF